MADSFDTMMEPRVEGLLERAGSKFSLVALASMRARQINSYYGQLGDGLGRIVPPQVTSSASKSLSIAFEEIAADAIVGVKASELAAAEAAAMADAADAAAAAAAAASTDD
ncbi:MAG TPA: DNA-directed RNA polymerase subunit omega [Microthrixaceae bacterium]|jgi:DNA-directed RNA polymerase subunit omega|nr:DNA-directed RNA polymerase subunit omega [Microthrixaceae bacterium]